MPPHPPPPPPPPPQPQEITQPSFLPTTISRPTSHKQACFHPILGGRGVAPHCRFSGISEKEGFDKLLKNDFFIMRHFVLTPWEKEVKKIRKIGEFKTCKTAVTATHPSSEPISSFLPSSLLLQLHVRRRETCQSEIKEEEGLDGKLGRVGRGGDSDSGKICGEVWFGVGLVGAEI